MQEKRSDQDTTRDRIVAMAARLSERPATSSFTLEQLAEKLDLHYTAIYHYFDGRDDLACALIEDICKKRIELIDEVQTLPGSALDRLSRFIVLELKEPPTDVPQRTVALLKEPFRSRAGAAQAEVTGRIARLLQSGQGDGSVESEAPPVTAEIIHRILNRYRNRGEQLLRGQTSDHISEVIVDLIHRGISVDPGRFAADTDFKPQPFPSVTAPDKGLGRAIRSLTTEFNLRGYDGTSIPRVARSVGVSKTSYYKYASSKEELLYLCSQQTMNLIAQVRQISKVITEDPVASMLHNLYYARYLHTRDPGPTLTIALFRSLSAEHGVVMWEVFRRWRDDLIALIDHGIEAGQVRPLEPQLMLPIMSICSDQPIDAQPVAAGYGDEVARFLYRGISGRAAI